MKFLLFCMSNWHSSRLRMIKMTTVAVAYYLDVIHGLSRSKITWIRWMIRFPTNRFSQRSALWFTRFQKSHGDSRSVHGSQARAGRVAVVSSSHDLQNELVKPWAENNQKPLELLQEQNLPKVGSREKWMIGRRIKIGHQLQQWQLHLSTFGQQTKLL